MEITDIQERLKGLAQKCHLVAIYVFGSRARELAARIAGREMESAPSSSDLDIGVLPTPNQILSPQDKVALTLSLEDIFNVFRVDLVVLPEAPAFLALDVVRGSCCIPQIQISRQSISFTYCDGQETWHALNARG